MSITLKAGEKKDMGSSRSGAKDRTAKQKHADIKKKSYINCKTDSQKQTEAETGMRNRTTVTLIQAKHVSSI